MAGTNFRLRRCQRMNEHFDRVTPKTLTSEERKERDRQRRADAELAMKEHEAAQRAFYANRERLRAERLAREAKAEDDAELARQSSQHH
jgi:hypothetical protein